MIAGATVRWGRALVRMALVAAAVMSTTTSPGAQNLPNHVDPAARDINFDPAAVPALRFLTTPDFPPFNYRDGAGNLVGFHIDLANAICQRLSAQCTIQPWSWETVQDALADNQGDALIGGLAVGEASGQRFDFSRVYLQLPARFVTASQLAPRFDPSRLTGSLAVREGTPHAALAARMLPELDVVPFPSEFDALSALEAGEVGAFFGDGMRAAFWLNENPDCCDFAGEAIFRPDLFGAGFAIAVPAGLDTVRTAIDWALVRLSREGQLDELYLRWFPVSFY